MDESSLASIIEDKKSFEKFEREAAVILYIIDMFHLNLQKFRLLVSTLVDEKPRFLKLCTILFFFKVNNF